MSKKDWKDLIVSTVMIVLALMLLGIVVAKILGKSPFVFGTGGVIWGVLIGVITMIELKTEGKSDDE